MLPAGTAGMVESPCRLYLGTSDGLYVAHLTADGVEVVASAVPDNAVRGISVHPEDPRDAFVGCGLRGWGLYHTSDAGETVRHLGFEDEWVWGVARHPGDPETVYVGTEPPMLYRSTDGGESFEPFDALDTLPSRSEWTFFHEPFYAGHVHGIDSHPARPERLFAGVEHGAVVYTHDGGDSWQESLVGADVHRVAVDPADPDRVWAATADGLRRSDDAGATWVDVPDLDGLYLHAIVFDPTAPDRMYVYAAEADAPLWRSEDGGASWSPLDDALPSARPADTVRLHPGDPETVLYAGDAPGEPKSACGRLFYSPDRGESFESFDASLPKVWRLEAAPLDA